MTKQEFKIGNKLVGDGHPVFFIAEAGINHQGELKTAKELIDIACFCKADAVKFQKRCIERILTKEGLDAPYDSPNSFGRTYGEHRQVLELSDANYREIKRYADSKGIIFLASAWDEVSADFLDKLGIPAFKTASADLTNLPLLEHIAKKGKPMILSTGMSGVKEVDAAVKAVRRHMSDIAVMQCTSTYPCKFEDIHLNVIPMYKQRYQSVVGYSGHELGIAVSAAAVAMGAQIVERHFTIDRTMKGGDHAASLEPTGLQKLIRDIRAVEKALGQGEKKLLECEIPIRKKLAKSVVTSKRISQGTQITRAMLTTKGPGTGLPASKIDEVVGRKAKVDIDADMVLQEEHLS